MQTSIEAYNIIKEKGLLSTLRFQVYEVLATKGAMTAGEIWGHHLSHLQIDSVRPRMAELERLGVIRPVDTRPCSITGMNCTVWETTNQLPAKLKTQRSKVAKIDSLRSALARAVELAEKAGLIEDANQLKAVLEAN